MNDTQYDPNTVADPEARETAKAPKARVPGWVWALIGVMGTLVVIGGVAIALLLPAWSAQRSGVVATGPLVGTVTTSVQPTPDVTPQTTTTSGGGKTGSSGGKPSGSTGSGSTGSSTGSGGNTGGSSGTKTGPTDLSGVAAVPNLNAAAWAWRKVYPADANAYFYGDPNNADTQSFTLPACNMRIEFGITSGYADSVDVMIFDYSGTQNGHYWTVQPGTPTQQPHYFQQNNFPSGQWYIRVIPHNGAISWRVRVDRWGLP